MKINEIEFYGFSRAELEQVRKETGKDGEEEYDILFSREVADVIGSDVMTLIRPGGTIALIKGGAA